MDLILQGSLRHFPPWQLLPFLAATLDAATLELEAPSLRLALKGGRAVAGEAAGTTDVIAVAAALLEAGGAVFRVFDGVALAPSADIDIGLLLEDAAKVIEDRSVAYADDDGLSVVDNFAAAAQDQISLRPDEFKVLFRIGAGRTFGELATDLALGKGQLSKMIKGLEGHGLLTVVKPEPAAAPPTTKKRKPNGSLTAEGANGAVYALIDDEHTIGRIPGNAVILGDASISSRHATITRTTDGFWLEDLKSRNGTFVNGEPVTEKRRLADNDTIRLGKVILVFNLAGEVQHTETTERNLTRK